jgi:hypothetical protein
MCAELGVLSVQDGSGTYGKPLKKTVPDDDVLETEDEMGVGTEGKAMWAEGLCVRGKRAGCEVRWRLTNARYVAFASSTCRPAILPPGETQKSAVWLLCLQFAQMKRGKCGQEDKVAKADKVAEECEIM